jgi:hypothetical protein
MFGRKKTADVLAEKVSKLNELKTQADFAVGIVTSTISGLELINQELDDTISEIDTYVAQLNETRESMNKNRKYNTAIIANFSKLLEVEEV